MLYGFIPWRAIPMMPVELMLAPKWFPFHIDKISFWGRTVTVPLLEDYLSRQVARTVKRETNSPDARQVPELKGTLRGEVVLAQVKAR